MAAGLAMRASKSRELKNTIKTEEENFRTVIVDVAMRHYLSDNHGSVAKLKCTTCGIPICGKQAQAGGQFAALAHM